jgi:hypothetical protein
MPPPPCFRRFISRSNTLCVEPLFSYMLKAWSRELASSLLWCSIWFSRSSIDKLALLTMPSCCVLCLWIVTFSSSDSSDGSRARRRLIFFLGYPSCCLIGLFYVAIPLMSTANSSSIQSSFSSFSSTSASSFSLALYSWSYAPACSVSSIIWSPVRCISYSSVSISIAVVLNRVIYSIEGLYYRSLICGLDSSCPCFWGNRCLVDTVVLLDVKYEWASF